MSGNLWSVVLAAGAGHRLSSVTGGMPKQFWRLDDGPSLLESTLDRLAPICPPERTVIVVGDEHHRHVRRSTGYRARGRILFQPYDRGTAAGLLYGLLAVVTRDPDAVVVVTPSDHGVLDQETFRRGIIEAIAHAQYSEGVVLFGVKPSSAREDYGWITLAPDDEDIRAVRAFVEKPDFKSASQLLASGAVWNTMVLVARAQTLIDLCRRQRPRLTSVFERALSLPRKTRRTFLLETYPTMEAVDLSRDILTNARGLWAYTWPSSMGWTDLGTPDRLWRWLNGSPRDAGRPADLPPHDRRLGDLQRGRPERVSQEESRP